MEDRCVACGEIVPEGRMVCAKCILDNYHIEEKPNKKQFKPMQKSLLVGLVCGTVGGIIGSAIMQIVVR